jgi:DNA-binding transcriptional ArsR family regulator
MRIISNMRPFRNAPIHCAGRFELDERLALLLHPVRLRLVHALRAGGALTTGELCARLPDLPKATVYRQVERLARGGVFEVESERKVRGVVERRYRLSHGATAIGAEDAKAMSLEDHRQAFTAAVTALLADFGAYLDRGGADPFADAVSYRQFVVWMSPSERARMIADTTRTVSALVGKGPGRGRTPHILSTIFFPASEGQSGAEGR